MAGWTTLRFAHAPTHRPPAAHKLHRAPPRRIEQGKTNNQKPRPMLRLRTPDSCQLRRHITRSTRPHPYNLLRATQHRPQTGHDPEIGGHVRRNTQLPAQDPRQHAAPGRATRRRHRALSRVGHTGFSMSLHGWPRAPRRGRSNRLRHGASPALRQQRRGTGIHFHGAPTSCRHRGSLPRPAALPALQRPAPRPHSAMVSTCTALTGRCLAAAARTFSHALAAPVTPMTVMPTHPQPSGATPNTM